ncbi:hypothetical protein VLK31_34575 [Variovorax sp. H27-G14]|uniref:hypothetical protein n=1 Tax=Variovorax sp. H27-G14 TaxID=3111914 RepID=UPI0038FCB636
MPTRATCEARLAVPDLRVEIIVTAALLNVKKRKGNRYEAAERTSQHAGGP